MESLYLKPVKVLVMEDNSADARSIGHILSNEPTASFEVAFAGELEPGLQAIVQGTSDVVLLDLSLPGSQGLETLARVRAEAPAIPIIILSGTSDEATAVKAVRNGAQDYLVKGEFDAQGLTRSIRYAIERKRAEEALRVANKRLAEMGSLKDEFVATVSHELRTPMVVIREGVSQVLEGILGPISPEQRDFLSIALENVDRLSRIINDLLDISRLEAGKMEIRRELMDMVATVKLAVSSLGPQPKGEKNGLEIKTSFPKKQVEVFADRDKVIQVLINLMTNAIKFTEKGTIEVSVIDGEDRVECRVRDTGKGIDEKDRSKLFEKFQQFGRVAGPGLKGTGLGLSICKGLVELHRGSIWVESRPGDGSTFGFTLPKITKEQLFIEELTEGINQAAKRDEAVSFIGIRFEHFDQVCRKLGEEKAGSLARQIGETVRKLLRRGGDKTIGIGLSQVLVVLVQTERRDALLVKARVEKALEKFLKKEKPDLEIRLTFKAANFPADGTSIGQLSGLIW